ncbi:MAG: hypothetical protein ABL936_00325 [Aestuariivirga sp.]
MYRITETYRPIKFQKRVELNCKVCDKKLTRIFSDFYTRSPFNTKTDDECRKNCYAQIDKDIAYTKEKGVICRACKNSE